MKLANKVISIAAGLALLVGVTVPAIPARAAGENLIANPSLEKTKPDGSPRAWQQNAWGANTANFEYLNQGRAGSRSVKTTVTSFTDGDAKWFFNAVAINGGATYAFSDYYKSDVTTEIVVRFTRSGDGFSYAWLGSAPASNDWALASFEFTAPANATKVTVFHLVSSVGWLILDDVDLREAPPPQPGDNLVANASVEKAASADPARPDKWVTNAWGANTANFEYLNQGRAGSRSVRTEITNYTDGDAKWYFDAVPIQGSTTYRFSDYYKSNVQTQLVLRYTDEAGGFSYEWLGTAPAAADWQEASFGFTSPASARQVSVFHIVTEVGWLVVDDVSLKELIPDNPIANPSVELESPADPTRPDGWVKDQWGVNAASFEYQFLNEGHDGSRSVKVTVGGHVDGDAKWYFDPIALEPGKSYRLSAWYKTNTTPHVVSVHHKANGTTDYLEMREPYPNANAATEWQHYEETFTVPVGTTSTTVYFFLSGNGWLQTDDFSLSPYEPVGFDRPLITLTFDDSFVDNIHTVLPVLDQRGFKSTQCFGSAFVESEPEGAPAVLTFHNGGHEICSHTVTHPFLTQLTLQQVQFELEHSQDVLEGIIGEPVINFASPYGDYNFLVSQQIKQYYRSHRTVDEGFNSKDNFDIERVLVKNMLVGTTLAEFQGWLDYAKATNTWLVLVYHRVTSAPDIEPFDTPEVEFTAQMNALAASGITVKTYNAALDELLSQL